MRQKSKWALLAGIGAALLLSACTIVIRPYYEVYYYANGSPAGSAPIDYNTYSPGDRVLFLDNTGNLTKSGSVFVGWNSRPDGSGTMFSPGDIFYIHSSSVELYAQWMYWTYIPDTWTLTYKWDSDTQWRTAYWTINMNKTFQDNFGGAGVWDISGNMIQLAYNNEISFYSGTNYISGDNRWNTMRGTMSGPDQYGYMHGGNWSASRGIVASTSQSPPSGIAPSGEKIK